MLYVKPKGTDAAFHFSVEDYFVERYPFDAPVFMLWQAERCAMLGSYQLAQAEIDSRYAKEKHIQVVRRQSGGGTIFTDLGTLLYSLILPQQEAGSPREAREAVAGAVIAALNKLGIPAVMQGRNDILVEGKKVSGLAQYTKSGRVCTHGSLLYETDLDMLTAVLRVDDEKIRSKAIRSVRSRVTNLKEHMAVPVSTPEFWSLLEQALQEEWGMREYRLRKAALLEIGKIYDEKYGNPDWTRGRSPQFSFHNGKRFPGGKVELFLDITKGRIAACSIAGDFLGTVPIRGLEKALENLAFERDVVEEALAGLALSPYLGDIAMEQFLSCMFE